MHDTDLSPDTMLQLAPALRTRLDAAGHVLVDSPVGTIVDIGPSGFEILSLFSRPLRLGDAIARLEDAHRDSTDFAPTMSVINMLIEESALIGPDAGRARTSGWADPVEHARMLHDDRRTGDYLAALVAAVRPGDVVLDIGTGSGVLSVAAARAGARRVYAVEATDIAAVAARVFEVNGVAGPSDPPHRLVEADRAAGEGGPAGCRDHRQRTVRGGDPRDHARRSSAPAEAWTPG